MCLRGLVDD